MITAAFYCGIKVIQFDLGLMHLMTLFLLSLTLAARTWTDQDFVRGAGFWAGLLIVFHPLLSLPVLGDDFSGVLLIKYQAAAEVLADGESSTFRFLTGGAGGPLSSFALQLVLLLSVCQSVFKNRKMLWTKLPGS